VSTEIKEPMNKLVLGAKIFKALVEMVVGTQIVKTTPSLLAVLGSWPGPDVIELADVLIVGNVNVNAAAKEPPTAMIRPP
jgi:hypothetical protein